MPTLAVLTPLSIRERFSRVFSGGSASVREMISPLTQHMLSFTSHVAWLMCHTLEKFYG